MKRSFVTYMGSSDFLPGILVLAWSLKQHNPDIDLLILTNREIDQDILSFLRENHLRTKMVDWIDNPNNITGDKARFKCVYTKLNIFGLVEYEKIVYLDADMIVCTPIDLLFEKPHMSAVNAGSLVQDNENWNQLNSGLLVIEPNIDLFMELKSLTAKLPSSTRGDQGFLHSYYPNWPNETVLHLEHRYNTPAPHLDIYCKDHEFEFDYTDYGINIRNISVLHFWGAVKPWHYKSKVSARGQQLTKYDQAINFWLDQFDKVYR